MSDSERSFIDYTGSSPEARAYDDANMSENEPQNSAEEADTSARVTRSKIYPKETAIPRKNRIEVENNPLITHPTGKTRTQTVVNFATVENPLCATATECRGRH